MSQQQIYEKNLLMEQILQQDSSGVRIMDLPKSADTRDGLSHSVDDETQRKQQGMVKSMLKSVDQLKLAEKRDQQSFNDQFESMYNKHTSIVDENIEEKHIVRR